MSSTIPTVDAQAGDADDRLVVHEAKRNGADRRIIYEPRERSGYVKTVQAWRQSIGGWHETGREIVDHLAVDPPEDFDQ